VTKKKALQKVVVVKSLQVVLVQTVLVKVVQVAAELHVDNLSSR
jgi:hypothetical protein